VPENKRSGEPLPEKLFTSQIGSAESRAIARRLVEEPTTPPNLLVIFVPPQPRGDGGELLGPLKFNSQTANIPGRDEKVVRFENESQEAFEERVGQNLPAIGVGIAFLFPNDFPPTAA
jgi:hypothetical protein